MARKQNRRGKSTTTSNNRRAAARRPAEKEVSPFSVELLEPRVLLSNYTFALVGNIATATDDNIVLTPPKLLTLEEAISWINTDELEEMTPESIRIRKMYLDENERKRQSRRVVTEE